MPDHSNSWKGVPLEEIPHTECMRRLLEVDHTATDAVIRRRFKRHFHKSQVVPTPDGRWVIPDLVPDHTSPRPPNYSNSWKGVPLAEIPHTECMRRLLGVDHTANDAVIRRRFKRRFHKSQVVLTTDSRWVITDLVLHHTQTNGNMFDEESEDFMFDEESEDFVPREASDGITMDNDGHHIERGAMINKSAFDDDEAFRRYFLAQPEAMRLLLTNFTKDSDWETLKKKPMFQQPKMVPDDVVSRFFFESFNREDFILKGGHVRVANDMDAKVQRITTSRLQQLNPKFREMQEELEQLKIRHNAAEKAAKRVKYLGQNPTELAVCNVYHYIRSTVTRQVLNDGGDTNAEITVKSVGDIVEMLRSQGVGADDVFMDGGCSYNVMASHVAQLLDCRVWGCEYVPTRVYLGTFNMMQALRDPHKRGGAIQHEDCLRPT